MDFETCMESRVSLGLGLEHLNCTLMPETFLSLQDRKMQPTNKFFFFLSSSPRVTRVNPILTSKDYFMGGMCMAARIVPR